MNIETWTWGVLWAIVTLGLLGLPWLPAWAEWRRPTDASALPASLPAHSMELPPSLALADGAGFTELQGREMRLGDGAWPPAIELTEPLERWQPPQGARPWGLGGWHIGRHLDIGAGQKVPCALVVRGRLRVHGPALIEGDLKARDELRLGPGTQVRGNVFCDGDIRLDTGCSISGLVMAEGTLYLAPGVVLGTALRPVSVCADRIRVQGPVRAHGSLHARLGGDVLRAPPAERIFPPHPTDPV